MTSRPQTVRDRRLLWLPRAVLPQTQFLYLLCERVRYVSSKPRRDNLHSEKVRYSEPEATTVPCPECGAKVKISAGACFVCGDVLPAKLKGIKRERK